MVTHNFRIGNPMDISNTTKDEVRYQHRGYGKYVEIAALFGWGALESYYHQVNLDYVNGVPPGPLGEIDDRMLKLSIAAGADLRPLIHFWGVHPQDSAALAQAINSNNLQPSPLIFNRLMHYKSIIPMDNAQFNQHALVFFNGPVPPGGNPDYGNGWYNVWLPLYNNSHGDSAVVALQKIIDTYFPDGRAYLICGSHVINDSLGNNNGMVDYNDPILLSLTMKNAGTVAASNVMVTLSSADAYITINDATENFGTIAANDSVTIPSGFKFTVAGNIPDNHMVSFDVGASDGTNSWSTTMNLIAHAPLFQVGSMTISDPAGNSNGRLDPGETAEVTITATNTGSSAAGNSIAMLNSSNGFIIINTPQVDLGNVLPGVPVTATFSLTVDPSAPFGSTSDLNYSVVSGQYSAMKTFSVKIGLVLEDFESGGFTHFSWIQGGDQPWTITGVSPFEGTYSAKSGTITHNQKSDLSQQMTVTIADSISFYLKTSSESGYDYLKFFIDATMAGQWAGETAWTKVTFPVSAGSHTVKWEYIKDGSVSSGSDCAWIDYIVFPASATMAASVTGAVTYANTVNSALAGLTIKLKNSGGTTVGTTTTNAAGNYTFIAVPSGYYTLQVTTTKPWGGVSASDALLFRKHIASISLLTGIFLASGDVNASGSLTSADVLLIK